MNNDINNELNNEILTEEEKKALNKKLKENENLPLPKSLSEERILRKLQFTPQFTPEKGTKEKKKVSANKKIARYIALAASFMIVVSSLLVWEPWNKGVSYHTEEPQAQSGESVNNSQEYAEIEKVFLSYKETYEETRKGYVDINGTVNFFSNIKGNDAIITEDYAAQGSSTVAGAPGTNKPSSNSTAGSANKDTEGGLGSENRNHGETNEQVEGVSEADIIKNDGKYLYTLDSQSYYNGYIQIFEPQADGKINRISKTRLSLNVDKNYDLNVYEMYIKDNKLVVLISTNQYGEEKASVADKVINGISGGRIYQETKQITTAIVYDITDKASPKEMFRVEQDGGYSSSRLIGDKLILISNYHVSLAADEEDIKENCIPRIYTDTIVSRVNGCDIHLMDNIYDTSYIVVSSFDIKDKSNLNSQAVLGAGNNFYCNTENLYVTNTTFDSTNGGINVFGSYTEDTEIHKFYIGGDKIEYKTNGRVKGRALNQFSVDEYKGYLRIATTIGDWGENLSNSLFVLDKDLKVIGEKNYIAKGETIKSVRFAGDTGYVVTFEQTDPLFVLDLSNPESPEIKGELKIPGFSTYLHPITGTLLLGIGQDGTESGTNGGIKVSLFDVSDPTKPKEVDKVTVSEPKKSSQNDISYINCPAYYSHKAVCYDSERTAMYIPYGSYYSRYQKTENGGATVEEYSQSAILGVKIDIENKTLEKSADYKSEKNLKNINVTFERATYIDNILFGYNIGNNLVSFDIESGKVLDNYEIE